MKIVMLNGQNHKGSSYHIGRQIIDKMSGENDITEFFFPKDLDHFCLGCYKCIEDDSACPYYSEKKIILEAIKDVCDALLYLGVPSVTKYGISVQAMNWESISEKKKNKIDSDTTKIAKKLSTDKKPSVGLKTRFLFSMMGMMQKNGWGSSPIEKEYWEKEGWFDGKRPWKE